jgi:hypothetical protein
MKNSAEALLRQNLIDVTGAFREKRPISLVSIGRYAISYGTFLPKVFESGENFHRFRANEYDRVMLWLSKNWPDGATWPAHVPRPSDDGEQAA